MKSDFLKLIKQKKNFLILVYLSLIVQLLITYSILYSLRNNPAINKYTKQPWWVYLIALIGIILILSLLDMPVWLKLIVFTIFSVIFGCYLYSSTSLISIELIASALEGAVSIFVTMSVVAIILAYIGIDLSWMALILLVGLIGFLIALVIVHFIKDTFIKKIILVFGLVLFSLYVLYSTNSMLQKNYNENFVQASLDFYLDFVNLFSIILNLEQ